MSRSFGIRTERNGAAVIVHVAGTLVEGERAERLLWAVRGLARRGVTRLVLDLEAVRLIDCAGLGLLVRCDDAARRAGASLRLAGAHGPVGRMLRMAALGDGTLRVSA
ncbi:MAG TPA: STAS domain-containing protein [Candidatus Polarisedimenticolia bacterium]|nr:STAS domain-containing protein [Candidatus Polarisedimenticolia bacterium]